MDNHEIRHPLQRILVRTGVAMADKISESGMVGQDGRMRLPMDRLNAFFAEHKGQRIIVRIEAAAPGSTVAQIAYYYNYIVPTIVEALKEQGTRKSESAVDLWLIEQYPGEKVYEGQELQTGGQLTKTMMNDFLEWLKQFAAENLQVFIDDPRCI